MRYIKTVYLYFKTESSHHARISWLKVTGNSCILLLCLAFSGCALFEPPKENPPVPDPTGVSGKVQPEAEQAYAKARILWGKDEVCSDPEKAMAYLDEALKIEPKYAAALARRGLLLSENGYMDEAFDNLTRSIRLEPGAEAYAYRGLCLLRQGNSTGARRDLDESIRLDPGSPRGYKYRGALSLQDGDTKSACKDFEAACSRGDCAFLEKAREEKFCK